VKQCTRKRRRDGTILWRDTDTDQLLAIVEPEDRNDPEGACNITFYAKPYAGSFGHFGTRERAVLNQERFLRKCGYDITNEMKLSNT
jgi:hypothetical protein